MTATLTYQDREYIIPRHHYSNDPEEAVFFYGGPFSNFTGGPFVIRSEQPWGQGGALTQVVEDYETVEHFFQASKAITAQDHDIIRTMRGPWDAKRAGRRTELRQDWEAVKYDIMLVGLRVKFVVRSLWSAEGQQAPFDSYRAELLATGNRLIAEDSPTDFEWGIRSKRGGYDGNNLLGKALMQVRTELYNSGW